MVYFYHCCGFRRDKSRQGQSLVFLCERRSLPYADRVVIVYLVLTFQYSTPFLNLIIFKTHFQPSHNPNNRSSPPPPPRMTLKIAKALRI